MTQGLRALQTRPNGLGATVSAVVKQNPNFLMDPVAASYEAWKQSNYYVAANGSLMRCHPLGVICVFKSLDEAFEITTAYGLVTHPNPACVVSCCIVVGLVRGLLLGEISTEQHIDNMIKTAIRWTDKWDDARRRKIKKNDPRLKAEPRFDHAELMRHVNAEIDDLGVLALDEHCKIGYVYKSLGATVFLLRSAMRQLQGLDVTSAADLTTTGQLFEQLITDLTMEAGDADTNACPAGAVLGAYLGYAAIPVHWRNGLKYGDFLKQKTDGLCQILGISEGDYDGTRDPHTAMGGENGFKYGMSPAGEKRKLDEQADGSIRGGKRGGRGGRGRGVGRGS